MGNQVIIAPVVLVFIFAALNSRNAKYGKSKFPTLLPYIIRHRNARPDAIHLFYSMCLFVFFSCLWAAAFSWTINHLGVNALQKIYDVAGWNKNSDPGVISITLVTCLMYLVAFFKVEKELEDIVDESASEQYNDSITRLHERINRNKGSEQQNKLIEALTNQEGSTDTDALKELFKTPGVVDEKPSTKLLKLTLDLSTMLLTYILRKLRLSIYQHSDTLVQCFSTEIHGRIGHNTICHYLRTGDTLPIKSLVDEINKHVDLSDQSKNFQNARIALNIIVNHIGYFHTLKLLHEHILNCDHIEETCADHHRCDRSPVRSKRKLMMHLGNEKRGRTRLLEASANGDGIYIQWDRYVKSNNVVTFPAASRIQRSNTTYDLSGTWVTRHSEAKVICDRIYYGVGLQRA